MAPSTRFERVAFRLGGERSIQLSYEGVSGLKFILTDFAPFVNQAVFENQRDRTEKPCYNISYIIKYISDGI